MKKVYYEKVGGKYIPVSEYDPQFLDRLPYGNHLIMVHEGGLTRRYNVEPALAPMIAAGRLVASKIAGEILNASRMRPSKKPATPEQVTAWKSLLDAFGDEQYIVEWLSAVDMAAIATDSLENEAATLLSHPAVKNAYDEFMLICKLTLGEKE